MKEGAVLLTTRGLSKSYGPFKAVDDVDLDIHEHDIHVFIGPNGAGKSTVLNMLGGQILPTTGEIVFNGKPLGTSTPSWRARAGIGRSFQLTSIIPGFTCLENVVLAVQAHRGLFGLLRLHSQKEDVAHATELLALVDLEKASEVPAELLSHGQQRQLEIAVALGGKPRLLLLDEPSSGMSAHERAGLGDLLKRVVNTATVVMAEHDVHVVRSVASRVTAFAEGKKIAEGSADDVFESADVKRVFLRGRRDA
ncbi:MAG: ABC transporter ATP-binding protein [Chloroflexi bacterium]|nr:ABC transporter ATP-binding protein [Chloroflexota bacterium]MBV9893791.1 ABC transporter ATP-binding protein [Chloroflexota bacterium]